MHRGFRSGGAAEFCVVVGFIQIELIMVALKKRLHHGCRYKVDVEDKHSQWPGVSQSADSSTDGGRVRVLAPVNSASVPTCIGRSGEIACRIIIRCFSSGRCSERLRLNLGCGMALLPGK